MATTRYAGNRFRTGRGGLHLIECILALSVIVGFAFVTIRIMNMGLPDSSAQVAVQGTDIVKTDAPPVAAAAADTETP